MTCSKYYKKVFCKSNLPYALQERRTYEWTDRRTYRQAYDYNIDTYNPVIFLKEWHWKTCYHCLVFGPKKRDGMILI